MDVRSKVRFSGETPSSLKSPEVVDLSGILSYGAQELAVLILVQLIPLGRVVTYGSLAELARTGPRKVGLTMRANPYPIVIPCHRVVGSGGELGGYSLGVEFKRKLLIIEGVKFDAGGRVKREYMMSDIEDLLAALLDD